MAVAQDDENESSVTVNGKILNDDYLPFFHEHLVKPICFKSLRCTRSYEDALDGKYNFPEEARNFCVFSFSNPDIHCSCFIHEYLFLSLKSPRYALMSILSFF